MKKRVGLICVCLLVLTLILASCGGDGPAPETTEGTVPPETTEWKQPEQTTVCIHPEASLKVTEKPATCQEDGYMDTVCELCGYTEHTVLAGGHDFEKTYQAATDAEVSTCKRCGLSGYVLSANESLELSGYFGGEISFMAEALGTDGKVELLIDGESVATVDCKTAQESEIAAKDVEVKQHDVTFVNRGAEGVLIKEDGMKKVLNRKGAVLVEVVAGKADRYNSINLYVQTSDPSGDYYVRYKMQYEYNDNRNTYKADSGTNISNYRIKTAQLVKVNEITDTAVRATDITEVLQGGEISLALKEKNVDVSTITEEAKAKLASNGFAGDFVGGFHGDERLESVELLVDGDKVDTYGKTVGNVIPATSVQFDQTATMYAWGTSTPDSYGIPMILHTQSFVFDSNGVKNKQSAEWLGDGYEFDAFYFQMFTMRREVNGKLVCENITSLDADGNVIDSMTVPMPVEKQTGYLSNLKNRAIRFDSDVSGVSAEAGYEVINDSIVADRMYVAARVYGDNKLYVSFRSAKNGQKPEKGEVFEVLVHYHIDYVNPEN